MGNLYIYGCSFSQGSWVNIKKHANYSPFYQNQFQSWYWGVQVANYFGLGLQERAIGGGANYTTLSRVMEDSHQYSKGDKVIIGLTKGNRYSLEPIRKMDFEQGEITMDTYSDINVGMANEYFRREDSGELERLKDNFKNNFFTSATLDGFGDDELGILMHFHKIWRADLETVYAKHYDDQFKQLQGMLYRSGVDSYIWQHDIWGEFQRVIDWLEMRRNLNQRKKDWHWSPNGNTSFAAYAISQILQDNSYWDKSGVQSYKKILNHNILSDLKPFVDTNFELDTSWCDEKTYPWLKNRKDIY